ncbi:unnamed protein product, partial [Mesorhabditis belari]|uniref:Uncharacterized protein n=1 Tax=Mesorhabditis belari TaxID=2138241 RepID=A0AAF3FMS2_9BILA
MRANLTCEICLLDASGLHFGVASCRACAAFFRRSVVLKLVYKCQKEHHCDVTKKQRFSCRCCRFQKCLDRGMRPSMVQPNSQDKLDASPQGVNLLSEVSTPPSTITTIIRETSPSISGICETKSNDSNSISQTEKMALYEKQKSLKNRVNSMFESSVPLTNFILPIKLSLTQQALVALNEHIQKWPLCTPEHIRPGSPLTMEELTGFINKEIENIAVFCMSLDDFAHLEKDQKWIVFKKFWNNFCALERYKAAVRCFGRPAVNIWVGYGGQYYDFQNYGEWANRQPELKKMIEFMMPSCIKEMALLGNQLIRMEPTDFELVFCMLQTMWNLKRDPGITETTLVAADDVKKRLAQEVHDYYTIQMRRSNYAARLMQMMNIIASLDEIDQQRKEDRTVCRTFDLCKDDIFYYDFTE